MEADTREEIPQIRGTVPLTMSAKTWKGLSELTKQAITSATFGTVITWPDGKTFRWIYRNRWSALEHKIRRESGVLGRGQ